jgi:cytochrome c oxidase cbb3-type subunit II
VNRGPFIFLGILATMALSFWGLIFIPQMQIGQQQQAVSMDTGELYPAARSGLAKKGAEVYRAEGCVECHTQQVRDRRVGTDFARGWGPRFTVAQDYLGDYPVMLGLQRVGPDLANVSVHKADAAWHLRHLYDPQALVPGSMMPSYRYLFEKRRITSGQKSSDRALKVDKVPEGYEIIPTEDAEALVAYLLSLRSTAEFWEAPIPRPPGAKPAPESSTNAAAGAATNTANAAAAPANPPVVPPSTK